MKKGMIPFIIITSLAVLIIAPFLGAQQIPFSVIFETTDGGFLNILWDLRIPRTLLGWTVGATLAVSGLIFQAMFRNPLASPDMLGVSTGAAFGAVIYIRLGLVFSFLNTISGISLSAFVGAMFATSVIYLAGNLKRGGMSEATLLLAGIAMSYLFGSLNMIVQYGSGFTDSFKMMRWSMGGLQAIGFSQLYIALPALILIASVGYIYGPELNLFVCGEDIAASRGVSVKIMRRILFISVSFAVGLAVSVCGPIGFVGLMVPHICRKLVGTDHRKLVITSLFFGGSFLVFCDTVARTMWTPTEVPVGILTSFVGSIFFLVLLVKGKR
ncbi:MAG: iron ABC transporter permease [Synergistaceae bacterium]